MIKILAIIGSRPQIIKHFAFEKEIKKSFDLITLDTKQHYDENMNSVFYEELGMSMPRYSLLSEIGNHGAQIGRMMIEIESIALEENPDAVVVYGDTNSTLAGAMAASKLNILLVHIEAGMRSFNKSMPEETNRMLTDQMSDILFVSSKTALGNLSKEGINSNVFLVGDIMKDSILLALKNDMIKNPVHSGKFYYSTFHRPYNVDCDIRLQEILKALNNLSHKVIFSLHPRTGKNFTKFNVVKSDYQNIKFIKPQSWYSNLSWLQHCETLITDSGGMQKEAYWLKKKCITVRSETEWVETTKGNWNSLVFDDLSILQEKLQQSTGTWDKDLYGKGSVSKRIASFLIDKLN